MESWHGRKISPVYHLMPNLQEPDWKSLRIGDVQEFWQQHDAWERRIELARKAGHIGDVLVLADEAPIAALSSRGLDQGRRDLAQGSNTSTLPWNNSNGGSPLSRRISRAYGSRASVCIGWRSGQARPFSGSRA